MQPGWLGIAPPHAYQLELSPRYAFECCALSLILVIAWPTTAGARELSLRFAAAVPLIVVLGSLILTAIVLGAVWSLICFDLGVPNTSSRWVLLSQSLTGGGGLIWRVLQREWRSGQRVV